MINNLEVSNYKGHTRRLPETRRTLDLALKAVPFQITLCKVCWFSWHDTNQQLNATKLNMYERCQKRKVSQNGPKQ